MSGNALLPDSPYYCLKPFVVVLTIAIENKKVHLRDELGTRCMYRVVVGVCFSNFFCKPLDFSLFYTFKN